MSFSLNNVAKCISSTRDIRNFRSKLQQKRNVLRREDFDARSYRKIEKNFEDYHPSKLVKVDQSCSLFQNWKYLLVTGGRDPNHQLQVWEERLRWLVDKFSWIHWHSSSLVLGQEVQVEGESSHWYPVQPSLHPRAQIWLHVWRGLDITVHLPPDPRLHHRSQDIRWPRWRHAAEDASAVSCQMRL